MIKASVKIILIVLWCAIWIGPIWAAKRFNKIAARDRLIRLGSRGLLWLMGISLKVHGRVSEARPLLLVSNHLSYVDIPMLASQATMRFVPKIEIASWPMISGLCRMTDCIFIDRKPDQIKEMEQKLSAALAQNDAVSLFPESTTGGGLHVLPFKSGFFHMAEEGIAGRELVIQPVAMTYTRLQRLPIDTTQWPLLAWYGDMYLMPHLWQFLKLGGIEATLIFLPTVTIRDFPDRKKLAAHCHRAISEAIEAIRRSGKVESLPLPA